MLCISKAARGIAGAAKGQAECRRNSERAASIKRLPENEREDRTLRNRICSILVRGADRRRERADWQGVAAVFLLRLTNKDPTGSIARMQ